MTRIVCLHGVPRTIMSERGTQFTSKFWHQLHQTLGTRLVFIATPRHLILVQLPGLPRTRSGYDSIWVVVDRLTKVAHFIPLKTTYTSAKLAKIYMTRIVCLHGVPRTIVSDRGTKFTSKFWNQLHQTLGTRLEFCTAFHP